jgi:predicted Zn finger-like uncharacterized protein
MIVKCDQCQTRFKIPDDKVTEKGVKVRCTKCSHTFRVKKGADGSAIIVGASAPAPAPAPAPVPEGTVTRVAPAAPPPSPAASSAATVTDNPFAQFAPAPSLGPDDPFNKPTRVAPAPTAPPPPADRPAFMGPFAPPAQPLATTAVGPYPQAPSTPGLSMSAVTVRAPAPGPDLESGPTDPALSLGAVALTPTPAVPSPPLPRDDPFGSGPPSGGFAPASSGPDRSLFDIPEPSPESPPPPPGEAPGLDAALQDLGPPPPPPPPAPGEIVPPPKPAGRPEDARGFDDVQPPGTARRITGAVVNLAVAAGLVVLLVASGSIYLNEGKLELSSLSPARMKALFFSGAQATVADVSNGLYETRNGRAIFYVRGKVLNRTEAPLNALVRAEILDGAELVRAAEGMAGAVPTPEDVYLLASAGDASRLSARLIREAKPLPPGGEAPFFLIFNFGYVQAPELARYRLAVTVREGVLQAEAAAPARKACPAEQVVTMKDLMVCELDGYEDGGADEAQLRASLTRLKALYPSARFARPDDPNSWPAIVQRMLDSREYAEGCKSCHDTFGAEWRRAYRTWKLKPYAGSTASSGGGATP